jgi:PKD repeat protein
LNSAHVLAHISFINHKEVKMKNAAKLTILALLANAASQLFAAAPPVVDWKKCLGGSLQDLPGDMIRTKDGQIVLLSNVNSFNGDVLTNHGSTDIWLTKLDTNGTLIWQQSIGGSSIDFGTGIVELENGNLVISGYTSSANGNINRNRGNFDALLTSTDANGNILWLNTYGGSKVDLCYSLAKTSDGGFVLGGGTYSNDGDVYGNNGDQDFWVFKTDGTGSLLWQHTSGGNYIDVCFALSEDKTGTIIASGATNSLIGNTLSSSNYDLTVLKLSADGNVIWNKMFGGSNYETAQTMLIDSRNRILIGGYSRSNDGDLSSNYGYGDSWIIQIDNSGNLLTDKNLGGSGSENLYSIIETIDGGYLLTSGSTSSDKDVTNSIGQEDIWLFKANESLQVEWSYNYGGSGNDRPVSVIQNKDGGFLVAGYTFSTDISGTTTHGSSDILLINLSCKVPTAAFSTTNICLEDTLNLNSSSLFASHISWAINNVTIATGNEASFVFPAAGVYNVRLNAQTCYNTASFTDIINVTDCKLPLVSFTTSAKSVCANSSVTFNNTSVNASEFAWEFPGGNPSTSNLENPVVLYEQPGTYNVFLTVTNNHGSQSVFKLNHITVNANPVVPVITSMGNELTSTPSVHYQWYLNNTAIASENSQSHFASGEGFYTVAIKDQNNCSSMSEQFYYSSTGILSQTKNKEMSVYPNPAYDMINISLPESTKGNIRIYNSAGQCVLVMSADNNAEVSNVNISNLSAGNYNVVYTEINGKSTQQTIIKY